MLKSGLTQSQLEHLESVGVMQQIDEEIELKQTIVTVVATLKTGLSLRELDWIERADLVNYYNLLN